MEEKQRMMTDGDNADAKWSESLLEGEDSERTMNCLRGRLLAERMASKKARDQAEQLDNKMMELENLLKKEAKSRTRAEKKLKFLMKKLESMNIPYATDEFLLDKTDISSASSSTASSSTKEQEKNQEQKEIVESPLGLANLPQNDSENGLLSLIKAPKIDSGIREQSVRQNAMMETDNQKQKDLPTCELRLAQEDDCNQEQDLDNHVDNSMALVSVDMPPENNRTIDPDVLDDTVKEVLETLRRAKEHLLSSMQRRRANMIEVG